jgi:hypothetical protein
MLIALHFRPSYIALGAVFPTTTKVMPTAPQGLRRLARYVRLLDGVVPLVAIGGIDQQVLPQVLATGVGCAAVVRWAAHGRWRPSGVSFVPSSSETLLELRRLLIVLRTCVCASSAVRSSRSWAARDAARPPCCG